MTAALPTRMVEKPWGKDILPEPFAVPAGCRIGEIWFEPPARLPQLLVKFIFTSDKLSVQVHPSDSQTIAAGLGQQGKEECWLVIDAVPGARLGIGFSDAITIEDMRSAALDGSIEHLLQWYPVQAGDFYYIPANTVHAIGAGVSLIEVQQNSDITYRLFDYGRPRELHLDQALAVALGGPHDTALHRRIGTNEPCNLVEGPLFRLDQVCGPVGAELLDRYGERPLLAIPRSGSVLVGNETIAAGGCALAGSLADILVHDGAVCLLAQPCH